MPVVKGRASGVPELGSPGRDIPCNDRVDVYSSVSRATLAIHRPVHAMLRAGAEAGLLSVSESLMTSLPEPSDGSDLHPSARYSSVRFNVYKSNNKPTCQEVGEAFGDVGAIGVGGVQREDAGGSTKR